MVWSGWGWRSLHLPHMLDRAAQRGHLSKAHLVERWRLEEVQLLSQSQRSQTLNFFLSKASSELGLSWREVRTLRMCSHPQPHFRGGLGLALTPGQ